MTRGRLILIEGLDRTGKTTQSNILLDKLKPNATLIKFPDRSTEIGQLIDKYLTDRSFVLPDQAVHLLFSANRWEVAQSIRELLFAGKHVVLDRYVYSGIAYSAAKGVAGMDRNWCLQPDKGLLKPDLTIFLTNANVCENQSRQGFGDERYEVSEFQQEVKKQFYKVFEDLEKKQNTLKLLNVAGKSIEQVANDIWDVVQPKVAGEGHDAFLYF